MQNKFNLTQEEIELLKACKDSIIIVKTDSQHNLYRCDLIAGEDYESNIEFGNFEFWQFCSDNAKNYRIKVKEVLKELNLYKEVKINDDFMGLYNGYGLIIHTYINSNSISVKDSNNYSEHYRDMSNVLENDKYITYLRNLGFLFEIKREEA